MMAREYYNNTPVPLAADNWHLPYVLPSEKTEFSIEQQIKMSVARCCRVSYLTVEGKVPDPAKDFALHDQLMSDMHFSPFEHVAQASNDLIRSGNFIGWEQYRQILPNNFFKHFDPKILEQFKNDYIIT